MILSDRDIRNAMADGRLTIDPPCQDADIQPASLDIHLGTGFRVFDNYRYACIDPREKQEGLTQLIVAKDFFMLHPGQFALANTQETITLNGALVARVEGKALALDTVVPTPHGWTTMGEIKPGDQVIGGNGEPCQVLAVSPIYLGNTCHCIVFDDGASVVADAGHRWMTWTTKQRSCESKYNARLKQGLGVDLLPAPSVITTAEIANSLRHLTPSYTECNHAVDVALLEGTETNLPIDPYILGAWLGDGATTAGAMTIGQADQPHFHREFTERGYPLGPRSKLTSFSIGNEERTRNSKGQYCDNGSFQCRLRTLGVLGSKHIPMLYHRASFCQRLELLRGLMDTDGHCTQRGQAELSLCDKRLADDALALIASLGIKVSQVASPAVLCGRVVGTRYRLRFQSSLQVFRMERKAARIRPETTRVGETKRRFIRSADKTESVAVRCIEVSAPDRQFLVTKSFIPTHNSSLGRLGLIVHATAGYIDPGWTGRITLELSNVANLPIKLYPDMKIGQLSFEMLSSPADRPYGHPDLHSKYKGQTDPTESKVYENFTHNERG